MNSNIKFKTSPFIIFMAVLASASSCIDNSCPHMYDGPLKSEAFVLGYFDQVDTLELLMNPWADGYGMRDPYQTNDPYNTFRTFEINEGAIFTSLNPPIIPIYFSYKDGSNANVHSNSPSFPRNQFQTISDSLGDTTFKQIVCRDVYRQAILSGRTVIMEPLASISVFSDKSYRTKSPGEDISEFFSISYTNPVSIIKNTFRPELAGSQFKFIQYPAVGCEFGTNDPFKFSNKHQAYETKLAAPYDLYWGEYIPIATVVPLKT